MKKWLSTLIVLIAMFTMLTLTASAAGNGSVSMGSASGNRGDTVSLRVNLNQNPGLVTMTIRVSYDTSVLQLTNVSNPGVLVGAQLNTNYTSPYTISWVDGATTVNNTKTGTVAEFTFRILDNAKLGDSTVTLEFVDSYDTNYNENSFSAASGKVTVTCKHSYGAWTKVNDTTHKRICSGCAKEETANHTWNSGTVTKQASCKETGSRTYTCTACSATKTETITKTADHKYGTWTKASDTTHKHTCSVCAKEETANHTWNSGTVTKKASCKEAGVKTYTCTACNATKTESVTKLTTHTYDHACDTDCNVCGTTRSVSHTYKTTWSKDQTNHWQECSVCKTKKGLEEHAPGAEATETTAQTCTTCGYIIRAALGHKHSYSALWTTDDSGHWYACSGCEEKSGYAVHSFENACDEDCTACGYTRKITHTFPETWTTDAENHWHACSACGLKQEENAHEPGAEATETTAQICTVCGCEITPALGIQETVTPAESVEESETPIDPVEKSETPAETTPTTTPTEPTSATEPEGKIFPWRTVVLLVLAGAAVLILIPRKSEEES